MAIAHRGELKKLGFKSGYHDTISEESPLWIYQIKIKKKHIDGNHWWIPWYWHKK